METATVSKTKPFLLPPGKSGLFVMLILRCLVKIRQCQGRGGRIPIVDSLSLAKSREESRRHRFRAESSPCWNPESTQCPHSHPSLHCIFEHSLKSSPFLRAGQKCLWKPYEDGGNRQSSRARPRQLFVPMTCVFSKSARKNHLLL